MPMLDPWCHSASIDVHTLAERAFDYLADGLKQGEWALGSVERKALGDNLYVGTSMFGVGQVYVRIQAHPELLTIHYHVGRHPGQLQPRNVIRVVPGPVVGRPAGHCIVTLLTWRAEGTADADWQRTCVSHETEMFIIKARLEAAD